ncbi:MAG: MFS transporter, partial [Turicibacter sp.]
ALDKDVHKSLILILVAIFLWFMAYNAVTTAFSRYAVTVWGLEGGAFANCLMVATIFAIMSYIPIGAISSRIGRKRSILLGIIMMFVSYVGAFFFTSFHPVINVLFALIGIGWAAICVNSLPMVVEMSKGSDIGKYTGFYYTSSMGAQIITPMVSGMLLQYVSYRTLFPYAALFSVLAFLIMLRVKHGDSKPIQKKSVLENFDIED